MKFKAALIAVAMLTAPAAMAADSMMGDIGNAAKDAAVQTGKDKAQQKMNSTSMGGMNMGSAASSASSQQVPTAQSVKDAAKDKAKEKASDAAGSAIDKALNKY